MDGIAHVKIDESSIKFTADTHFLRGIYTNHIRHSAKVNPSVEMTARDKRI